MKFYTNFLMHRGKPHVRGYDENGKQFFEEYQYSPSLYLIDSNATDSEYHTMDDQCLKEIKFQNAREMREFAKKYDGVSNFKLYGFPKVQYNAIRDNFKGKIEYDPSLVRTIFIDGEMQSGDGTFPEPSEAKWPVTAISVVYKDKCICFGLGDFDINKLTQKYDVEIVFKRYTDEATLLRSFVNFVSVVKPDIISGWNIESFDIPYLVNRITNILGEDIVKQLSPYGSIRSRTFTNEYGKEETIYTIEGVATLDYLLLYKKHTFVTRESYKLDHIAYVELGERKIEYDGNIFSLYDDNPQLFFEYNCKDSILVQRLDKKLGLIALVLNLSYFAKVTYNDTFSPVAMWDAIVANRLFEEGVVVPFDTPHSAGGSYEGAYVHDPVPGRYGWLISVDLNSMYPMNIRSLNIGPDTYVKPEQLTPELREIRSQVIMGGVNSVLHRKINITHTLKEHNLAMAANGEFYRRDKEGIMSRLVAELYEGRKADKKAMLKANAEMERLISENGDANEIARLSALVDLYGVSQLAKKVALNSLYGALANEHFRHYRLKDAEAITISGQVSVRNMSEYVVELLRKSGLYQSRNILIYNDTDSGYFDIDPIVEKLALKYSGNDLINAIDEFIETKIQPVVDKSFEDMSFYLNMFQNCQGAKREAIAESGIWTGKKRYALYVWDMEGVRYNHPHLKVTGIETNKSSTPEIVREALKESLEIMLGSTEKDLRTYVESFEHKFKNETAIEDVAFPRSVNGVAQYSDALGNPVKGCPGHVSAALAYNRVVNTLGAQYRPIQSGSKIKFVYLKNPNPYQSKAIAFEDRPPAGLNLQTWIDWDQQFYGAYLKPLENIMNAVGWSLEERSSLDDFFG